MQVENRRRAALGGERHVGGDSQGRVVKFSERRHFVLLHCWGLQNVTVENEDCEDIDGFGLWLWGKQEKLLSLSSAQKEVFSFPVPPAMLSWCHGASVLSTQFRWQHVDCFPMGEMCWGCRQLARLLFSFWCWICLLNTVILPLCPADKGCLVAYAGGGEVQHSGGWCRLPVQQRSKVSHIGSIKLNKSCSVLTIQSD